MFRNVSKNIKTFGEVICLLGWLISLLAGFILLFAAMFQNHVVFANTIFTVVSKGVLVGGGFAVILFGLILSYTFGICIYGIGEAVEKSNKIENQINSEENTENKN